jgi:hypothetical protein
MTQMNKNRLNRLMLPERQIWTQESINQETPPDEGNAQLLTFLKANKETFEKS